MFSPWHWLRRMNPERSEGQRFRMMSWDWYWKAKKVGSIEGAKIYNRALSPEEVATEFNATLGKIYGPWER